MKGRHIEKNDNRIVIHNGGISAAFEKRGNGWVPGWFYQEGRKMLRFKDHEWLSLGHLRGTMTDVEVEGSRIRFSGTTALLSAGVSASVSIEPAFDGGNGFTIRTVLCPDKNIELIEAMSSFEVPYEYDGEEESLTVMGNQAVVHWKSDKPVTIPFV